MSVLGSPLETINLKYALLACRLSESSAARSSRTASPKEMQETKPREAAESFVASRAAAAAEVSPKLTRNRVVSSNSHSLGSGIISSGDLSALLPDGDCDRAMERILVGPERGRSIAADALPSNPVDAEEAPWRRADSCSLLAEQERCEMLRSLLARELATGRSHVVFSGLSLCQ